MSELGNLKIDSSLKDSGARPHRKWVWAIMAVLLISAIIAFLGRRNAPIDVQTMVVKPSSIGSGAIVLNATGYIIAAHKIELAPRVVGRVAWVGVERADKVAAGQELVRLEDEEYRARLVQAEGQYDSAQARLEELENGTRPEEVGRAKADVDTATAELQAANARVERTRAAAESKAISAIELEEATFRQKAQESRVAALTEMYQMLSRGPRKEQIDAQRGLVKQSGGILQLAKVDLANTIIKAPVAGTILERNVEVGEYVTTGFVGDRGAKGYVVSLADLSDLRVELDVSQDDFAKVARDQKCQVTTDAYPDRKYDGQVDLIAPEANRQKATVQVRVKILKPDELLRPDMNASVAFIAAGQPDVPAATAIIIPMSAVRDKAVFVVQRDKIVRRTVELGSPSADGIAVKTGLAAGEEIVLNPPPTLAEGSAIRRQEKP